MEKYTVYYQTVGSRGFRILGSIKGDMGPLPNLKKEIMLASSHTQAEELLYHTLQWRDGWPADEEPFKTWLEQEKSRDCNKLLEEIQEDE